MKEGYRWPDLISEAAERTISGLSLFSVPSWSSGPYKPQAASLGSPFLSGRSLKSGIPFLFNFPEKELCILIDILVKESRGLKKDFGIQDGSNLCMISSSFMYMSKKLEDHAIGIFVHSLY